MFLGDNFHYSQRPNKERRRSHAHHDKAKPVPLKIKYAQTRLTESLEITKEIGNATIQCKN